MSVLGRIHSFESCGTVDGLESDLSSSSKAA